MLRWKNERILENPTWADIAATIDPGRKNSLPTPSPPSYSNAFLHRYETPQRAISDQTTKSKSRDFTDGVVVVKPRANSATLPQSDFASPLGEKRVSFSLEENGSISAPSSNHFNVPEIRLETPPAARGAGRRGRGSRPQFMRSRSDGIPNASSKRNGDLNHLETLPEESRPIARQQQYFQKLHCPTGSTRSAAIHGGYDKWMWKKDKD